MNFKPFVAVVLLSGFASSAFANHPVPPSRKIDWTYTGVPDGIPNRTNICATFSPGATAAEINNAISFCNDGVVFLNAGTYTAVSLGGSINVNHDHVTLKTIITVAGMVSLGGSFPHAPPVILGTAITGGAAKGSKTFTVASTVNLSPGTMIEIERRSWWRRRAIPAECSIGCCGTLRIAMTPRSGRIERKGSREAQACDVQESGY